MPSAKAKSPPTATKGAKKKDKAPSPITAAIAKGGKLANLAASRARPIARTGPIPLFTQDFADKSCAMIADGVPQWVAFEAQGVPRRTAQGWMEEFPEFGQQVLAARAKVCADIVTEIRNAVTPGEFGVKDWKARAWAAAKIMKEDFAEEKGGASVNVDVSLSAEVITALAARV